MCKIMRDALHKTYCPPACLHFKEHRKANRCTFFVVVFLLLQDPLIFTRAQRTSGPIGIGAVICRVLLVTFQYVQTLLVGRVRLRVVGWAEAATICVSHPVSTVTRPLRPLRGFNPFRSCTYICMITKAKDMQNHCSWYSVTITDVWQAAVCLNVQKLTITINDLMKSLY